jgi:hypothetical protein
MISNQGEFGCQDLKAGGNLDDVTVTPYYKQAHSGYDDIVLQSPITGLSAKGANIGRMLCARCKMDKSDFTGAKLELYAGDAASTISNTSFRNADLRGSQLGNGAQFLNVDFTGATLTDVQFRGSRYDDQTKWPSGFDPAAAGLEKTATGGR